MSSTRAAEVRTQAVSPALIVAVSAPMAGAATNDAAPTEAAHAASCFDEIIVLPRKSPVLSRSKRERYSAPTPLRSSAHTCGELLGQQTSLINPSQNRITVCSGE